MNSKFAYLKGFKGKLYYLVLLIKRWIVFSHYVYHL